jgi:hypothetical protein
VQEAGALFLPTGETERLVANGARIARPGGM